MAKDFEIAETPNYNKYATVIQRNYKKHLRKVYQKIITEFLFVNVTKLVCLYSI